MADIDETVVALDPGGATSGQSLQLLDRALKLIFILREYDRKVSLQELATALNISKSAVHRLVGTLSRLELVVRDEAGRYQFGPKMKELSADMWSEADVREVALPYMQPLRDVSGETVSLHVLDGVTNVVVEQCPSLHEVQWVRRVGRVYTVLSGANACALLAFLPAADVLAILQKTRTSSDRGATEEELQKVRRLGYALYTHEGAVDGLAIAAPIFARDGRAIATMCISGPRSRFDAAAAQGVALELRRKTLTISRAMGYRVPRDVIA